MWPSKKRKQELPRCDCGGKVEVLHQRVFELNNTLDALIAENRIDRQIPDQIRLISGQYRKMSRRIEKFEASMRPVFALIRNLRNFVSPGGQ